MTRLAFSNIWLYVGLMVLAWTLAYAMYQSLMWPDNPVRKTWLRYVQHLDTQLRFLMLKTTGIQVARWQVVGVLGWVLLVMGAGVYWLWVLVPVWVLGPSLWFDRLRAQRVTHLEQQLDTWLLALANSLKASSSLGDAIMATQKLMHAPMSQELDLLIKEQKLGVPLDQAVRNMGDRIGSRTIASGLVTLLVARQSGGNLPATLENSAAALREMARLEGVVRTKTAEGKAQAYVMGAVPLGLAGALHWMDPELMQPLFRTPMGNLVLGIAITLWLSSVFVGRKILAVDI